MRGRQRLVRSMGGAQHGSSPSPDGGSAPTAAADRRGAERPALAFRPAGSATAAAAVSWRATTSTAGGGRSAWGTSSRGAARLAATWRASGSSVRALTRGAPRSEFGTASAAPARSVTERRRERRRPSGSSTTTYALARSGGDGRRTAIRSHAQRSEHGEDGEHRTFPAASTRAASQPVAAASPPTQQTRR